MIFGRRALQRRLIELRSVFDPETVDGLAVRLNTPDKMRLGAVWETVVLHALTRCGAVQNEVALPSGRRPDILYEAPGLTFIADVTAVSDESIENDNPYREIVSIIEAAKKKLGLPIGGMDMQVRSSREPFSRRNADDIVAAASRTVAALRQGSDRARAARAARPRRSRFEVFGQ